MAGVIGFGQEGAGTRRLGNMTSWLEQLVWFAGVAAVAFLIPFVFSSLLALHHDLYYLLYFAIALTMLGTYVQVQRINLVEVFTRNWKLSVGLGIASAAFVIWSVLAKIDSTPHPSGAYFAFEIFWRGAIYAIVDALLLSAFPGLVAWRLMNGNITGVGRRIGYGGLTLLLVGLITATYHAGYEDLQNTKGIAQPELGNGMISIPVIVSANPLGSIVAHTSMHLAAVTHSYESKDRLPPQVYVESSEEMPHEIQLSESDAGRQIVLAKGGKLLVALPSNPSTGFSWAVSRPMPSVLRQEGEPRFVPAGSTLPVVGAGGTEVFTFTAVQTGTSNLELEYRRPFEAVPPARTFSIDVVVR
jgi:inhibitor of cysteine peptidase